MKKAKNKFETHFIVEKKVMQRITHDKITPRPLSYFLTKRLLTYVFLLSLFLLNVFFLSMFIEKTTTSRVFGLVFLVKNLPWFSFGISISMFLLAFAFLEKLRLFYKVGLINLFLILLGVVFSISFFVHKTSVPRWTKTNMRALYEVDGKELQVLSGTVSEFRTSHSFVLRSAFGKFTNVYMYDGANIKNSLNEEDQVYIIGVREGNVFYAKEVNVSQSF